MAQAMGFYTDTTVCIGCKACQVACHQWNGLPAELAEQPSATRPGKSLPITGHSYDNTGSFSDVNWRHVKFIEKSDYPDRRDLTWLMMSDVCKHCVNAPCLEVCPTGAIIRTEFDSVYIQSSVCNGCRACVSACPSESIQFGPIEELKMRAQKRVAALQATGQTKAQLYGADERILGGLNSFYLLVDEPETYGLPRNPQLPSRSVRASSLVSLGSAILLGLAALISFRRRGEEHDS
jgi:formate dehydrogenase iron-sulfur subunit